MAIYKEDFANINLESGTIQRSFANRVIGEGDINGNRFGVNVLRNGAPVSLTGHGCVGYFIRPDNITLVIAGTISGNKAYVEIPEAAYAVEGNFTLAIKVSGTRFSGTMRIIDGTIVNTTTGTINDPSSELPDIDDYTAAKDAAVAAAEIVEGLTVTAEAITGTRYQITVTKE